MEIDIVDLSSPQYNNLNVVQLAMVRAAQAKKNKVLSEAALKIGELFSFMLGNGVVRSTAYALEKQRIEAQAQSDVEFIKMDLDYQLAYEAIGSEGNESGPYRYPQNPNYSLSYSDRFLVVRQYYMEVTSDPEARLQAYSMDTLARSYLGEYYQTLYDYLAHYC